jgi:hypothetical protein
MDKIYLQRKFFGIRFGIALALLVCSALVSCDSNRPEDPYISVADKGVTVEDVVLDADEYVGKQVTIAGTIKETFGEQAFVINGEKLVDGLLAVGADPYPNEPNEKFDYRLAPVKAVRVTGIVRRFDAAAVERETGVKLEDSHLKDYAGKPVIIVKSLQPANL